MLKYWLHNSHCVHDFKCFIDINKLSNCISHFRGQKAIAQHSFFLLMISYVTFDNVPLSIWYQKLNVRLELNETIILNNRRHFGLRWGGRAGGRFCFCFIMVDNNYIILEKKTQHLKWIFILEVKNFAMFQNFGIKFENLKFV